MRRAVVIVVLLAACESRRPPVGAGEGILVTSQGGSQTIAVDPAIVPMARDCADGELVWRARDGVWGCIPADTLLAALPLDRQAARMADVDALRARLEELEAKIDGRDRCAPLPAELSPPDYQIPAASCLIADSRDFPPDSWTIDQGWVAFRPGRSGRIFAFCPLLPNCNGADGVWNRLQVVAEDPDGAGAAEKVTATVFHDWARPVGSCAPNDWSGCQAQSGATAGTSTLSVGLGGYRPDLEHRAGNRAEHWLEVQLDSQGGGVRFKYAQID